MYDRKETREQIQWKPFFQLLNSEKPPVLMIITVLILSLIETAASLVVPVFYKKPCGYDG